jgi:hypothetical protein
MPDPTLDTVASLEAELIAHDAETRQLALARTAERSDRAAAGWTTDERDAHNAESNRLAAERMDGRRAIIARIHAAKNPTPKEDHGTAQ